VTAPATGLDAGRTALVTGATTGIGRATAAALAERGARVLLVARDRARGRTRRVRRPSVPGPRAAAARPEVLMADLRDRPTCGGWPPRCARAVERLDVLVNNAGAYFDARRLTPDGVEATFALNHLAYFLLTTELLGPLQAAGAATGDARVVVVASEAHQSVRALPLDDLQGERRWAPLRAYAVSKLANVMFAYALARRLAGTGVAANALHPGVIASGFASGSGGAFGVFFRLARPFLATPERGARTSVYLAADPAIRGATGGYYKNLRPRTPRRPAATRRPRRRCGRPASAWWAGCRPGPPAPGTTSFRSSHPDLI
jgi:NAD(P)-dependent dehydrogenase (short-subunit alcohol dehydrogenase family)